MANEKSKELESAWELDKKYGTRITQAFALHEKFLLLAGKIEPDPIVTVFGDANVASLLVQRLDAAGAPSQAPFKASAVASAIVEKIERAVPTDFPAIVMLLEVASSKNPGKTALVIQYVGDTDLLAEFGVDAAAMGRELDNLRPVGDRIPI